jgi:hypothetical protein
MTGHLGEMKVPARDVMPTIEVTVDVRLTGIWRVRLGVFLLKLARLAFGSPLTIVVEGREEAR